MELDVLIFIIIVCCDRFDTALAEQKPLHVKILTKCFNLWGFVPLVVKYKKNGENGTNGTSPILYPIAIILLLSFLF